MGEAGEVEGESELSPRSEKPDLRDRREEPGAPRPMEGPEGLRPAPTGLLPGEGELEVGDVMAVKAERAG